jgi:hypothetical protein
VTTKGRLDGFWGNYTMYGLLGTYSVAMTAGGHPSDGVTGVGLGSEEVPGAWSNTAFRFTFQLTGESGVAVAAAAETPAAPAAEAPAATAEESVVSAKVVKPAGPTPEERLASLQRALVEAVRAHILPLDPEAPLYRYARQQGLGERLSDEFAFEHDGIQYGAQAFEKGIVYAPAGQPDQVAHTTRAG